MNYTKSRHFSLRLQRKNFISRKFSAPPSKRHSFGC